MAQAHSYASAETRTDYVNLGDSFAAGSGVWPPVVTSARPGADVQCWQSANNAAHIVARTEGLRLTDASCGGADTSDFYDQQLPGVEPQLSSLSAKTDVVTVAIGGNNGEIFGGAVKDCVLAGVSSGFRGTPCRDKHGSSFVDRIKKDTYPAVKQALTDVHRHAPNARIAILTYAWITPENAGPCPGQPVAPKDIPYMHGIQAEMNSAIRKAAAETHTDVIDVAARSVGHDSCKPVGTRWIEPLIQDRQIIPVHPNALGNRMIAEEIRKYLRT